MKDPLHSQASLKNGIDLNKCVNWDEGRGPGWCSNLVENMLAQFLEGPTQTCPFREVLVKLTRRG